MEHASLAEPISTIVAGDPVHCCQGVVPRHVRQHVAPVSSERRNAVAASGEAIPSISAFDSVVSGVAEEEIIALSSSGYSHPAEYPAWYQE